MSESYRIREATAADADELVRQRVAMFTDMGTPIDAASVERAFREWLLAALGDGTYRAWLVEDTERRSVGGGGVTLIPWPPGPWWLGGRLAFVYNVYTDPAHRRRGIARRLMTAIHAWCRAEQITALALNASPEARPLYESMGYVVAPSPMMFFVLPGAPGG